MPGSPPIEIDDDNDEEGAGRPQSAAANEQNGAAPVMGSECMICLEPYEPDGEHKLAVLACGHHAGKPCLQRWIRDRKCCPTCRKRAKASHIIVIYNPPTVVVKEGAAAMEATKGAAAPGGDPQREEMLQAVQRAYSKAQQEALKQAAAKEQSEREARRQAEAAERSEREAKRLRLELQEAQRQMAALQQQQQQTVQQQQQHLQYPYPHGGGGNAPWHASQQQTQQQQQQQQQQHNPQRSMQQQQQPPMQPTHVSGVLLPPLATGAAAAAAAGAPAAATQHMQQAPLPPSGTPSSMWGHFNAHGPANSGLQQQQQQQQQQGAPSGTAFPYNYGQGAFMGSSSSSTNGGGSGSGSNMGYGYNGASGGGSGGVGFGGPAAAAGSVGRFERMFSLPVEGCRLLALDVPGSRVLVSETKGAGMGSSFIRKISLYAPECHTRIHLPANTSLVCDMQLQPTSTTSSTTAPFPPGSSSTSNSCLAAVATWGAGLCLVCPRSEAVVAAFTGLPYRPCSCSWVPYNEHLLVAGLEKGHLALLDNRRTDRTLAVLAALKDAPRGAANMPVRNVAALPLTAPGAAAAGGADGGNPTPLTGAVSGDGVRSGGGVVWPHAALSCPGGAWLMVGGSAGDAEDHPGVGGSLRGATTSAAAAPTFGTLLSLDGGFGAGSMNVESMAVFHQATGGWYGWGGGSGVGMASADGVGQPQQSWRVALSWTPKASGRLGGIGAGGPRHEVGIMRLDAQAPYVHEATVSLYSRRGDPKVRSCLLPASASHAPSHHRNPMQPHQQPREAGGGLLLASSDDVTHEPLIYALNSSSCSNSSSGGGGSGGAGAPNIVQRLDPHPEPPSWMVAAAGPAWGRSGGGYGGGPDCYLGCASQSLVVVYQRRGLLG